MMLYLCLAVVMVVVDLVVPERYEILTIFTIEFVLKRSKPLFAIFFASITILREFKHILNPHVHNASCA